MQLLEWIRTNVTWEKIRPYWQGIVLGFGLGLAIVSIRYFVVFQFQLKHNPDGVSRWSVRTPFLLDVAPVMHNGQSAHLFYRVRDGKQQIVDGTWTLNPDTFQDEYTFFGEFPQTTKYVAGPKIYLIVDNDQVSDVTPTGLLPTQKIDNVYRNYASLWFAASLSDATTHQRKLCFFRSGAKTATCEKNIDLPLPTDADWMGWGGNGGKEFLFSTASGTRILRVDSPVIRMVTSTKEIADEKQMVEVTEKVQQICSEQDTSLHVWFHHWIVKKAGKQWFILYSKEAIQQIVHFFMETDQVLVLTDHSFVLYNLKDKSTTHVDSTATLQAPTTHILCQ